MIYRFSFTTDDYIESNALQKANARENKGVYHLVLLLGLGCIAYLNTAVLRSALTWNDPVSYGVGIVIAILFLIQYSPRIIPSILIPIRLKYGLLPKGLLGPRSFETTDDRLIFSSSDGFASSAPCRFPRFLSPSLLQSLLRLYFPEPTHTPVRFSPYM